MCPIANSSSARLMSHRTAPWSPSAFFRIIEIHFRGDNVFYDLRDHDQRLLGEVPLSDITREQVDT
jgi:hypothetical protein